MSWGKRDDRAAMYPAIMAVLAFPEYEDDERIVNELRGFIVGLYDQCAAYTTDYVVDWGNVRTIGGARFRELVRVSTLLGLLEECLDVRGLKAVRLKDDPNFVHVRSQSDIEWEHQQKNDGGNPALAGPVRARDGDNCRYCRAPVHWRGTKSPRSGSLDHLNPGEPGTVETVVVACQKCNSTLRKHDGLDLEPLRDAPAAPRYGVTTAKYLAKNGYIVLTAKQRAYIHDDDVKGAYLVRHGDVIVCGSEIEERGENTGKRPVQDPAPAADSDPTTSDTAQQQYRPSNNSDPHFTGTPGSGRVGSGTGSRSEQKNAGTGSAARKRNRRSKRGKPPTPRDQSTPPTEDS